MDYNKKIKELEDELKKTKYNKATQGHIGIVKAKIAQLKEKQESRTQKKTGRSDYGYSVRKSGDGTILILGFPSAGKSTLLNKLTGASSEVGAYAFTTLSVIPGMLEYKQSKIQILDVPGIVSGAASGKGRGKEVLTVIRTADMVLIVIDVNHPEHHPAILKEVWDSHIRVNKVKPEVYIKKKSQGGIHIGKTVPLAVDDETLKRILREFKVVNAEVLIRSPIDIDDFIDCIEGNKKYIPAITCITKADLADVATVSKIKKELNADFAISAEQGINIEILKEKIFQKLDFIRIYMKEPGKDADMKEPLIIKRNSTINDVCNKLHRDFPKRFKFARVWGSSTKFPGQRLMLNHCLKDKDILEIHLR
ncbi:MAG: GTP-binding protein [Nanoarchaeota archaeon]|nr:GTP-binding protein [Nanoarchaeota archaeon]MBU1632151.1 GTP-binding protein [Nanoarchaeota archaeon]MBU1876352.1 GTP-binding protein [Nanoarchaeota archaeon]